MLRSAFSHLGAISRAVVSQNFCRTVSVASARSYSSHKQETDDELDQRYIDYFNRTDIDGWETRQAMNDIQGHDMVPHPTIIIAALKACRRMDDYSAGVRFLESVKYKCGNKLSVFWPYILQEIRPTLDELGMDAPEDIGYDKPELARENVYDM